MVLPWAWPQPRVNLCSPLPSKFVLARVTRAWSWENGMVRVTEANSPPNSPLPSGLGMRMVSPQGGILAGPDPPFFSSEYLVFPFLPSLRNAVIQKYPSSLDNLTGEEP